MQNHSGFDGKRLDRISRWMQGHVDDGRLAGLAVQVSRQGDVVFSDRVGLQDAEAGTPVQPNALWRVYSMTKPVTSLAAMMLYEEGAFQLDQPLADFLPAFADMRVWKGAGHLVDETEPPERPVTIHDLMTH